MAKLTLRQRATRYSFKRDGFSDYTIKTALRSGYVREGDNATEAWLAGYRAAQKDMHEATYSRKVCPYCAQPKDGHKHEFHRGEDGCGRIKEHCECNVDWVKEGLAVERKEL